MGELILCNQALAALPYYLEDASLNIYSLEELSYYIEQNAYLLGPEFMNEELCNWIGKEFDLRDTAQRLHEICQKRGSLWEFVSEILQESGYCTKQERQQIKQVLQELEHKSEFECGKIRADRYLENGTYVNSIYEYRKLLGYEENNPILLGNVWHNLGCAYAKLFLFEKAAECFKAAYTKNDNPESLRECMYAYRCAGNKEAYIKTAAEFGLTDEQQLAVANKLSEFTSHPDIRKFEQEMDTLFASNDTEKIDDLLEEWKMNYRKNCRI